MLARSRSLAAALTMRRGWVMAWAAGASTSEVARRMELTNATVSMKRSYPP